MKKIIPILAALFALSACAGSPAPEPEAPAVPVVPADPNKAPEAMENHKFVIYQMMTRLFGNKVETNKIYGTQEENGVGKFADITPKALEELKKLGTTHVWYTGVLEHATMDDYSSLGITPDDSDVIKGRAGSPYAIKDYYDVNPQMAVNPRERMKEFEALVARTHAAGLKVMIDFVPNHVARFYKSDAKPAGVEDLGAGDDTTKDFSPANNFYYINGQTFKVPKYDPLGPEILALNEDGQFAENPPKATGNDGFRPNPSKDDWFETVKLNYGVDYQGGKKKFFDPIPSTWIKMKDILVYWAKKGVDGFRCDMAEMVPVEFWAWAVPQVKAVNKDVMFLAEIYNPSAYAAYLEGGFDYLYDKVGLYDTVKRVVKSVGQPGTISQAVRKLTVDNGRMLRFLENHDEERIASKAFAKSARPGFPGMVVSATLGSGPVMIYFGQEVGEPGAGNEGFGREDNRTTIFDYWGVPEHQKWMNGGSFDGGRLSPEQKKLREDYARLLTLTTTAPALKTGAFYEVDWFNRGRTPGYDKLYAFLRFNGEQKLLVVANFSMTEGVKTEVALPDAALKALGLETAETLQGSDLLGSGKQITATAAKSFPLELAPMESLILELK